MTSCRRGGGGVPFSMTRHDKGGRGGHEVHDIMLGEKLSKTLQEMEIKLMEREHLCTSIIILEYW